MLAEKAALLGRDTDTPEPEDRSRSGTPAITVSSPTERPDPLAAVANGDHGSETPPRSEKARGKMRAHSDSTTSLPTVPDVPDEELMRMAAAGIGPSGFVPTQDWVSSWQKG